MEQAKARRSPRSANEHATIPCLSRIATWIQDLFYQSPQGYKEIFPSIHAKCEQAMRAWRAALRSTVSLELLNRRGFSYSGLLSSQRSVANILEHGADGENISVTGWVRSVRKQKRIAFVAVSDGSTIDSLQAVLKPEDAAQYVSSRIRRKFIRMY